MTNKEVYSNLVALAESMKMSLRVLVQNTGRNAPYSCPRGKVSFYIFAVSNTYFRIFTPLTVFIESNRPPSFSDARHAGTLSS